MCVAGGLEKPLGMTVWWPVVTAHRTDVGMCEGESEDAVGRVTAGLAE